MTGALAGRVALVTGASSGIGEATALALAQAGATVAVCARRADRLHALVRRLEAAGHTALALPGDVTDEGIAKGIVADCAQHFGRLDILVNSAGIIQPGRVSDTEPAVWRRALDINLMATLYTCMAALGYMRAQGAGDIINVSSIAGRRASAAFGPYSTSKFALNAMTEGLRQDAGAHSIRVCIVEPGATTTEVSETIEDPTTREAIRKHVTRADAMKAEDVAAAIVFVVSLPPRANVSEILLRPTSDVAGV